MEFATIHLDTYKVVTLLQEKGYSKEEAEGFIQAIQEITLSGVATRQDVLELQSEIQNIKAELTTDIQALYSKLQATTSDLKDDLSELKNDSLKFLMIQTLAIVGVMVALFQFFSLSP